MTLLVRKRPLLQQSERRLSFIPDAKSGTKSRLHTTAACSTRWRRRLKWLQVESMTIPFSVARDATVSRISHSMQKLLCRVTAACRSFTAELFSVRRSATGPASTNRWSRPICLNVYLTPNYLIDLIIRRTLMLIYIPSGRCMLPSAAGVLALIFGR